MSGVLVSVLPQHLYNICTVTGVVDGERRYKKSMEVRKSKPKLETPFTGYLYCGGGYRMLSGDPFDVKRFRGLPLIKRSVDKGWLKNDPEATSQIILGDRSYRLGKGDCLLNGTVVGEFVCDEVVDIVPDNEYFVFGYPADDLLESMCLTQEDLQYYGRGKTLYGWQISDLKIYETPKSLGDFKHWKKYDWWDYGHHTNKPVWELHCLTRAPQSWCYVENLEGGYVQR